MIRIGVLLCLVGLLPYPAYPQKSTPADVAAQVREYRTASQHHIVAELVELLPIPNVAADTPNIQRNAAKLVAMLNRRGIATQLVPIPGRGPVVFGRLDTPGATRTVLMYAHYDGQPISLWEATRREAITRGNCAGSACPLR